MKRFFSFTALLMLSIVTSAQAQTIGDDQIIQNYEPGDVRYTQFPSEASGEMKAWLASTRTGDTLIVFAAVTAKPDDDTRTHTIIFDAEGFDVGDKISTFKSPRDQRVLECPEEDEVIEDRVATGGGVMGHCNHVDVDFDREGYCIVPSGDGPGSLPHFCCQHCPPRGTDEKIQGDRTASEQPALR